MLRLHSLAASLVEEQLTSFNSFVAKMKEVLALYKKVIGNYRPLLDGERYLTDQEVAQILNFITGRIALIFQNPLFFTTFLRNFVRILGFSLYKGSLED